MIRDRESERRADREVDMYAEPIPGQLTVEDALAETAEASQDGRYRDERAETDTK